MIEIDVVVPVYKGQCYIAEMIRQTEVAAEKVAYTAQVRLILINDAPDDPFLKDNRPDRITVLAVNTDQNRGIHGARVRGLSYCQGEYVVFLDQDDRIFPDYFLSQFEALTDADAVVCRGINGGRLFYDNDRRFEEQISAKYMFSVGNGILSPGQVMIRREAIPQFWQEHILQHNGADDWMLWLCMLYEGKQFTQNQDVLYEHVISSQNCSGDTWGMYQSEQNVYELFDACSYMEKEYLVQIRQALDRGMKARLQELDRQKNTVDIFDTWMKTHAEGHSVSAFLKNSGFQNVAIYGMGKIGLRLYQEIRGEMAVTCFLDRNAAYRTADIPVYTLDADLPQVDLIIIALADEGNRILNEVLEKTHVCVRGIEDILLDMLAEK